MAAAVHHELQAALPVPYARLVGEEGFESYTDGVVTGAGCDPQPMNDAPSNDPKTGRLRVHDVERLHAVIGGDPHTEAMIVRFIADRYGATSLLRIGPKVAEEILRRPVAFIRAAKKHNAIDVGF